MLSVLSFSPSLHLPPLRSSSHPSSKRLILIPRLGPKFQIGVRPTVGSSGAVTKLPRFAALDGDCTIKEYGRLGEAQATLRKQPTTGLDRNISWRKFESVLNGISKWLLAALYGLALLWKRDAEVLWAAIGSVINSWLSTTLKRILNHERPVSGLRSDPGMPSSHAQSIFYAEVFAIFSMVSWLGLNLLTMTIACLAIVLGCYISWLRISEQFHTLSQVLVGALLGSIFGAVWCWLWHSFVLRTFVSSEWVRVMVVLGSIAFFSTFMGYIIQHWLKDEP